MFAASFYSLRPQGLHKKFSLKVLLLLLCSSYSELAISIQYDFLSDLIQFIEIAHLVDNEELRRKKKMDSIL